MFRTKTGICTLTPEKLVLKRQGVTGQAAERVYGNSIARLLAVYGALSAAPFAACIWFLTTKNYTQAGLLAAVGALLLWAVAVSRNNSAVNIIDRSAVHSVDEHPPRPRFTRGYFAVNFPQDGKKSRRLTMLPSSMANGDEEFRQALKAMRDAGWL